MRIGDVHGAPPPGGEAKSKYLVAFEKIRASLVGRCVRRHPDFQAAANWSKTGRPFEAFSDASDIGWAMVLTQRDRPHGTPKIIAIVSKAFTDTQLRWSAME